MKIKISTEKIFFNMIITFNFFSSFFQMFFSNFSNKYVLIMLITTYLYLMKYVLTKNSALIINLILVIYTFYNAAYFGIAQVLHSDYYTFVLLVMLLSIYVNMKMRSRFLEFFLNNYKRYLVFTVLFWIVILSSILCGIGLKYEIGSSIPILYGPYEVQHQLGYILIGIYCALSIYQYNGVRNKLLKLEKILCMFCVVWTGARSALLGLVVVVLVDYFSVHKLSKKVMIASISLFLVLYIIFFTDFLSRIPVIQRTMYAISQGSITNGRERFADILLEHYNTFTNLTQKIFGIGMTNLRDVMKAAHIGGIHAHNDYVNALVGYGLVGLVIYIVSQVRVLFSMNNKFYSALLGVFLFILSYYNGLAMYAFFTPVLIIIILYFDIASLNKLKISDRKN